MLAKNWVILTPINTSTKRRECLAQIVSIRVDLDEAYVEQVAFGKEEHVPLVRNEYLKDKQAFETDLFIECCVGGANGEIWDWKNTARTTDKTLRFINAHLINTRTEVDKYFCSEATMEDLGLWTDVL